MYAYMFLVLSTLSITVSFVGAVKCYHCFEVLNNTITSESVFHTFNENFVPCVKDQKYWNSWDCPSYWPVCIITTSKAKTEREIVRSCGQRDFCSNYVPPKDVFLESCRECETPLCNDFSTSPNPPVNPGPTFNFNINIKLNLKQIPSLSKGIEGQRPL